MKIAINGYTGRVGTQLVLLGCVPLVSDITFYEGLKAEIKQVKPDIVINLAGYSNVDWCEDEKNQNAVFNSNFRGALNIANACAETKCGMVFLSTDHIFDGKRGPYKENYQYWKKNLFGQSELPVNYYGLTKMAGEGMMDTYKHVKIVRTSYLFDANRLLEKHKYYPTFLYRSFMHIEHFAKSLFEYANRFYEIPKILNISGSDTVSWYKFASEIYGKSVLPRRHDLKGDFVPRPYKAGLNVELSAKLGLPQFSYTDGIKLL